MNELEKLREEIGGFLLDMQRDLVEFKKRSETNMDAFRAALNRAREIEAPSRDRGREVKISIKDGWFQVVRGYRVLFAIHPARRVIWRNRCGTKYTAIEFPWQKQEQPK